MIKQRRKGKKEWVPLGESAWSPSVFNFNVVYRKHGVMKSELITTTDIEEAIIAIKTTYSISEQAIISVSKIGRGI